MYGAERKDSILIVYYLIYNINIIYTNRYYETVTLNKQFNKNVR